MLSFLSLTSLMSNMSPPFSPTVETMWDVHYPYLDRAHTHTPEFHPDYCLHRVYMQMNHHSEHRQDLYAPAAAASWAPHAPQCAGAGGHGHQHHVPAVSGTAKHASTKVVTAIGHRTLFELGVAAAGDCTEDGGRESSMGSFFSIRS